MVTGLSSTTTKPVAAEVYVGIGNIVEFAYEDGEVMEVLVERAHDPQRGAISIDSPVGHALKGAREGEWRLVMVDANVLTIQVLRIR